MEVQAILYQRPTGGGGHDICFSRETWRGGKVSFHNRKLISFLSKVSGRHMMRKSGRIFSAVALVAGILLLAGCPTSAHIADINQAPGRFADKDVSIHGTVSEAFSALGNGVYQVDDGTGKIWVFSQNYGIPGNGVRVAVTGRVEQG